MATRDWTVPQVLAHTMPQLESEIRRDRADRGEPEDGAIASEAEARAWMRKLTRGR